MINTELKPQLLYVGQAQTPVLIIDDLAARLILTDLGLRALGADWPWQPVMLAVSALASSTPSSKPELARVLR